MVWFHKCPWINPPKHGLNKLTNTWWRHKVFSALLTLGDLITLWRYCVWGVSQNSREITHAPSTHRDLLGSNRRASFLSQVSDVISPLCLQCMMQSLGTFISNGFMRSCQERPNIWDQQNRIHINNGQFNWKKWYHYNDVLMGAIAPLITSLTIVYWTAYSEADQRKHQSPASLAFVWGIHRGPVNSPHKWPVTRKMFPFDDVIMPCCSRCKFSVCNDHMMTQSHGNAIRITATPQRASDADLWFSL